MMVEVSGPERGRRLSHSVGAMLRRAQVTDFVDDGEGGTGPTAVPRPAGLLSPLTGTRGKGCASHCETRRFFAFVPYRRWVRSRIVA